MNKLLQGLQELNNQCFTEKGGLSYSSTLNKVYDLFALGGAYRNRSVNDCILLFKEAFEEDEELTMKCLFYLRDREGQGERRFFKEIIKWLASNYPDVIRRNMDYISHYGRWDDLYAFIDTPLEDVAFTIMKQQFELDLEDEQPSLLGKWLASENTSSKETRKLAVRTRKHFGLSSKEYRKALSLLREKIRVTERLMSENRWDEIEFDKLPSKAGLNYRKAFARREETKDRYKEFVESKETKVNAGVLYPYEVVNKALSIGTYTYWDKNWRAQVPYNHPERLVINKYWDNLTNYFNDAVFNGIVVADTSASMEGTPMNVAISLAMYCAEKCSKKSPFYGHYIEFSSNAKLVEIRGIDFVDKVNRIAENCVIDTTNIQSVFDLLIDTIKKNNVSEEDIPKNIVFVSDMEFDMAMRLPRKMGKRTSDLEYLAQDFTERTGYKAPSIVFWNVNARNNRAPMKAADGITYVSGFSPVIYKTLLTGKSNIDLMLEVLNSERYALIS